MTFKPTIEPLNYDFTETPKIGGAPGEMCSGKGTVPEPTDAQIAAYLDTGSTPPAPEGEGKPAKVKDESWTATLPTGREQWTEALVALGIQREHLDELPSTAFHQFKDWLGDQLLPNGGRSASED